MKKARGIINYTGNKEKLLPTISQYFPKHYNRFVDAFCGGLSVSLYVEGDVLASDYDHRLIDAYKAIDECPDPVSTIKRIIAENGLNKEDKDAYIAFRKKYNENPDPLSLFVLIQHSFSNINRHNRKGEFNANFGRRTFNENAVERILNFKEENKDGRINFTSGRYDEIEILPGDFVYSDIPYLITSAEYNKLWSVEEEIKFYKWLESLMERGISFGLSNVTHHRGKVNQYLLDFIDRNPVHCIKLNKTYCLDRSGGKSSDTQEVYVTNVDIEV